MVAAVPGPSTVVSPVAIGATSWTIAATFPSSEPKVAMSLPAASAPILPAAAASAAVAAATAAVIIARTGPSIALPAWL